jgi:hypothetical protein
VTDQSRHTSAGRSPTERPATIDGPEKPCLPSLDHLRRIVVTNPGFAERLLTERRVPDPVLRHTLQAEILIRLGNTSDAATVATRAVQTAAQEDPVAPARLLPAAVILADCAVLSGAPDAAGSCIDLKHLARNYADHSRMIIAVALRGVAIYHQQSCQHARRLFNGLHVLQARVASAGAIDAALVHARDTIDACCTARRLAHQPPSQRPAFTVCGLVQPQPAPGALADRILRLPGRHDCTAK